MPKGGRLLVSCSPQPRPRQPCHTPEMTWANKTVQTKRPNLLKAWNPQSWTHLSPCFRVVVVSGFCRSAIIAQSCDPRMNATYGCWVQLHQHEFKSQKHLKLYCCLNFSTNKWDSIELHKRIAKLSLRLCNNEPNKLRQGPRDSCGRIHTHSSQE